MKFLRVVSLLFILSIHARLLFATHMSMRPQVRSIPSGELWLARFATASKKISDVSKKTVVACCDAITLMGMWLEEELTRDFESDEHNPLVTFDPDRVSAESKEAEGTEMTPIFYPEHSGITPLSEEEQKSLPDSAHEVGYSSIPCEASAETATSEESPSEDDDFEFINKIEL